MNEPNKYIENGRRDESNTHPTPPTCRCEKCVCRCVDVDSLIQAFIKEIEKSLQGAND